MKKKDRGSERDIIAYGDKRQFFPRESVISQYFDI